MQIRLLRSAKADLRAGIQFYESLAPGLGTYFLECIEADIDSLQHLAGIHPFFGRFHRLLATRFPFAVYYLCDDSTADVYAILDCRRDPQSIAHRLSLDDQADRGLLADDDGRGRQGAPAHRRNHLRHGLRGP